jgi:hypothetical protein
MVMRVRIKFLDFEDVTFQELAEAGIDVKALLGAGSGGNGSTRGPQQVALPEPPPAPSGKRHWDQPASDEEVAEVLGYIRDGRIRGFVKKFLDEVSSWDDVFLCVSPASRSVKKYVRVHVMGEVYGAIAYVRPPRGVVNFRLSTKPEYARYAADRGVSAKNPLKLTMTLMSEAALEEALKLVRTAYEAARVPGAADTSDESGEEEAS